MPGREHFLLSVKKINFVAENTRVHLVVFFALPNASGRDTPEGYARDIPPWRLYIPFCCRHCSLNLRGTTARCLVLVRERTALYYRGVAVDHLTVAARGLSLERKCICGKVCNGREYFCTDWESLVLVCSVYSQLH